MIPLMFGPPVQPATPIPPQVAVAYAMFTAFHLHRGMSAHGEEWKGSGEAVRLTAEETAARNAALLTLRQYVSGENFQEAETDLERVGMCKWEDLPAHVQQQLLQAFPPNWQHRSAMVNNVAADVAKTKLTADSLLNSLIQQLSDLSSKIEKLETGAKPQRRKPSTKRFKMP
mgnify:CR=1 FL=1